MDQRNAPSRCRLRPADPIDLRRSDCLSGEPSSFGAPCSVQSASYRGFSPTSSGTTGRCPQIAAFVFSRVNRAPPPVARMNSGSRFDGPCKSAPSPVRLRPAIRPTAAEATAARRAINLGRSVLGALGTLRAVGPLVKCARIQNDALCEVFFTMRTYLRQDAGALLKRDQGFAEPGALSSTSPTDLPLPRTALRKSFVLVASRARRSGNLVCPARPVQGIRRGKPRKLRKSGERWTTGTWW